MAQPENKESKVGREQQYVGHSNEEAHAANIDEHDTTVWAALKGYKWGVFWSLIVSMSVVMEGEFRRTEYCSRDGQKLNDRFSAGYDTILMGNFLGFPAFQQQFGDYHGEETGWQVPAAWRMCLFTSSG
jgi:MFS transporter, SP family, general alpha glucoside:H+ symporter